MRHSYSIIIRSLPTWTLSLIALACLSTATSRILAHDPVTEETLKGWEKDGTLEDRLARMRRNSPEKLGAGLGSAVAYKLRKEALRANGASPEEISDALFGGREMALPYAAQPQLQASGLQKTLTILVDFADFPAATELPGMTADTVKQNIYGQGTAAALQHAPYESVNAYYRRASQGLVDIQGNVLGWYHFPKKRDAYKPDVSHMPILNRPYAENAAIFAMVSEALDHLAVTEDLTQYDNDKDGFIDCLTILYTGPHPNANWGTFWWAYRWEFLSNTAFQTKTFGPKKLKLKQFIFSFVDPRDGNEFDPRTLLHEMGHAFGLPDYYHYSNGKGPLGGVGGLDMMDANWGNHNAFSRWLLDWIKPEVIGFGPPAVHQLTASGSALSTSKAIAIFPGLSPDVTAPAQEMFIIENRFQMGNDGQEAALPGDGLLIWHVGATPNTANNGFMLDNSNSTPKLLQLVRANRADDFPIGYDRARSDTFFNAPAWFGPATVPSSNAFNGLPTNIVVKDISPAAETMTLTVGFDLPQVPPAPQAPQAPQASPALPSPATASQAAPPPNTGKADYVDLNFMEEALKKFRGASADELKTLWESQNSSPQEKATRSTEIYKQLILTQWARKDGVSACQAALNLPPSAFSREAFSRVMETWANHNPSSAAGWYFDEANMKKLHAMNLVAGKKFAEAVFRWFGQNDFDKAVAQLDHTRLPELDGALTALKSLTTASGVAETTLRGKLETLKAHQAFVLALDEKQQVDAKVEDFISNSPMNEHEKAQARILLRSVPDSPVVQ